MKKSSVTYQLITKLTAVLLLIGFLLPTGLQAQNLADFCMMKMNHHDTMEMADDHSSCADEESDHHSKNEKNNHSHDCDGMGICACNISHIFIKDKNLILVTNEYFVILPKKTLLTPFITSDEPVSFNSDHKLSQHKPPLWLMHDTFLM